MSSATTHQKTVQDSFSRAWHGVPKKERDMQTLVKQYDNSDLHVFKPGRKIKVSIDRSADVIWTGVENLEHTISEWFTRCSHPRLTAEDWGIDLEQEI
jgi:hypothetical protein